MRRVFFPVEHLEDQVNSIENKNLWSEANASNSAGMRRKKKLNGRQASFSSISLGEVLDQPLRNRRVYSKTSLSS